MPNGARGRFLVVCLNPVIQKTLVFAKVVKGEVNRCSDYRVDASGKGINVARVLGQLGRDAVHLSQLGGPMRGWFLDLCAADALEPAWVESGSDIRLCVTMIDRADGSATELVEEARPVAKGTAELVLAEYDRLLPTASTVMLSGTKAAGFPETTMPELAKRAAAAGKRLVLDLKGRDLLACLPFGPIIAKPNLEELIATYAPEHAAELGLPEAEGAMRDLVAMIGREYREKHGCWLVVTRGSRPTLFWDGQALRECPVRSVEALNPIGSGDSFNAGLASALDDGATIAEAVDEGTRLGALNAQRLKPGSIVG